MKYLIRAVKYFFYFAILTTAIVYALILIGAVEGGIENIFEDGYNSLYKIAIFFAIVAAVYPKFGFVTRKLETEADWDTVKVAAKAYFQEKPFKVESEGTDSISFRRRDPIGRLTKMCEDRITISRTENGYSMEGLRKDVFLYATGVEIKINN
ncbi:MAG: hypothetical protein IKY66_00645 [Bacteroidales bacterium]|nr:hypothetical protein [Bacteroidales bacterium]